MKSYFSVYHYVALYICVVLAVFAFGVVLYKYLQRREQEGAKKLLIGYGCICAAAFIIITAGTLMAIDAAVKSTELRHVKYSAIGDEVLIRASIFNTGKAAVKYCTITARVISTAKRKVDASIFAPRWFDANKLNKRASYEFSQDIKRLIAPGSSEFISIEVPRPFKEFKLKVRHACN